MEKEIIKKIQKRVIKLLRKYSNKPLYITSADNCSEIARLVGYWIFEKIPQSKIFILKGKKVKRTKKCHDILAVECKNSISLIDPTVWQFFRNKRSIFIKTTKNMVNSLFEANKIYGGNWKISETFKINDYKKNDLEKMIASNIEK